MAAPALEGLGPLIGRLIAALGASVAAREAVKSLPGVKSRESDCATTPDETECNLYKLKEGHIGPPSTGRYVVSNNRWNYDYQIYIANLHAAPERFGYMKVGDPDQSPVSLDLGLIKNFFGAGNQYTTLEWHYGGVEFDGFWRSLCTVVETKANFEKFFDEEGGPKYDFVRPMVRKWLDQQDAQIAAITPAMPQAKLQWHFAQPTVYDAALKGGLRADLCHLTFMIMEG